MKELTVDDRKQRLSDGGAVLVENSAAPTVYLYPPDTSVLSAMQKYNLQQGCQGLAGTTDRQPDLDAVIEHSGKRFQNLLIVVDMTKTWGPQWWSVMGC